MLLPTAITNYSTIVIVYLLGYYSHSVSAWEAFQIVPQLLVHHRWLDLSEQHRLAHRVSRGGEGVVEDLPRSDRSGTR